jgi:type III pantothenate kinase
MITEKEPLLAIDIGNSTIGLGFYHNAAGGKGLIVEKTPLYHIKTSMTLFRLIINLINRSCKTSKLVARPIGVVISSVVPELNRFAIEAVKRFCPDPLVITYTSVTGLTLEVSHPDKLGSDRLVNAFAGYRHCGKPVAVIDLGTATTITVVGKHSNLLGGAIMPGIGMMREALASGTARLPLVTLSNPPAMLGTDTESALASGIINGTVGAVESIVRGIEKEAHIKLHMILTGGHAGLIDSLFKREHVVIPNLIFEGMRLIHNLNRET